MREFTKRYPRYIVVGVCMMSLFLAGCASFFVKGSEPISRSISVTQLMIEGKTSDGYIKIYLDEMAQAKIIIESAQQEALINPEEYSRIADKVDQWIALYNNIKILSERYPNGLDGKKLRATFKYVDYNQLKKIAKDKASDMYFEKALGYYNNSNLSAIAKRPAIAFFEKAASYSSIHDAEIRPMAADLCYSIADEESKATDIKTLSDAVALFRQAIKWVPGYKDAPQRIADLDLTIAQKYVTEGDNFFAQKDYSAFRKALDSYKKAEQYVAGIALQKMEETHKALTIRVTYLFRDGDLNYVDRTSFVEKLSKDLTSNKRGPAAVSIEFVPVFSTLDLITANFSDSDLILVPDNNYGKIEENFGPAQSSSKTVTKTVENMVYSGEVVEQSQKVTVSRINTYNLYDNRYALRKSLKTWNWKQLDESKTFVYRQYFGNTEAKPDDFSSGELYAAGQYNKYFPVFQSTPVSYDIFNMGGYSFSSNAREFLDILESLPYVEK